MKKTYNELIDEGLWEDYCEKTGTSLYAINEGTLDGDEEIEYDI
jgi:hypothetical protein